MKDQSFLEENFLKAGFQTVSVILLFDLFTCLKYSVERAFKVKWSYSGHVRFKTMEVNQKRNERCALNCLFSHRFPSPSLCFRLTSL